MKHKFFGCLFLVLGGFFSVANLFAQADSVDVTFYYKPSGNPWVVFLPGEFNNWGPNSGGVIAPNAPSRMNFDPTTGRWFKTVRLRVGGHPTGGVRGAYQYRFNETGCSTCWLSDPLNPRYNPAVNNNSILYVNNPTIHYLLPNSTQAAGIVKSRHPVISAYIFPSTKTRVDTASIVVKLDDIEYKHIGAGYDAITKKFTFTPTSPLSNGLHRLILLTKTAANTTGSDTTSFTVQADPVQILTQPAETWKSNWPIRGEILKANGTPDSTLRSAILFRGASSWAITVKNGQFDTTMSLHEGPNVFSVRALVDGVNETSQLLTITRRVNHTPYAVISFDTAGTQLTLRASSSTDPDGQPLIFTWEEDATNPQLLGINDLPDSVTVVTKPNVPGEYYFTLTARDPDGNTDHTRQFFTVTETGQVIPATIKSNPAWVKQARVYEIFIHSFTPEGTLKAATAKLNYVKAMGFNVIWLMPIMKNRNGVTDWGGGYDIIDFYQVDSNYGTMQDLRNFIDQAHTLGLKVVLDITPNHVSDAHPWVQDARLYKQNSRYWNYLEHRLINHDTNGLGQSLSNDGVYIHYSNWALANLNNADLDCQQELIRVFKFWLLEVGADGFRFDVYWGPSRRYGEGAFWRPVREALKHVKPEIWLLAEAAGVGIGTEVIYADHNGGSDSGYDWPLYGNGFRAGSTLNSNVSAIHNKIFNNNYYPGPNSYFFRFLENHDETRLARLAASVEQTMPYAATLFTIPGIPLVYAGQEVGFGNGIDEFEGKRGKVNFNDPDKATLQPFYQKLAHLRGQFPALWTQQLSRLQLADNSIYAYVRPWRNQNLVVTGNFNIAPKNITLNLASSGLEFGGGLRSGAIYYVNDLLAGTSIQVDSAALAQWPVSLPGYGVVIYSVSVKAERIELPTPVAERADNAIPAQFVLHQNFPNPFNPETMIRFELPRQAEVRVRVFNLLGEEVVTILREKMSAGTHTLHWDGRNANAQPVRSGVYLLRLDAGHEMAVRKIMVLR
ncbi:MAG: alpha-amylase family glycosyl hydrolase [candidate division KSB1 bacterium]|nr:alpha-amylase family glycosyl hydrolase [candidate division KSB1 bacterium]